MLLLPLLACSEQAVTKNNVAPEAAITAPAEGATVAEGAVVALRGAASDTNDEVSTLTAGWFAGGRALCAEAPPEADGTTVCDATLVDGEEEITLEVRDPQGALAAATVHLVVIPDNAPVVEILSPTPTTRLYADALVSFAATVSDTEERADTLGVVWSSSLDGPLTIDETPDGSGGLAGATYLSEGEHYLTLTATDSLGSTGEDGVILDVHPANSAPGCAITAPLDGEVGQVGDAITFRAVVSDVDVPADTLDVTWASDWDGTLGASTPTSSGDVAFTTSALSPATHTITMTVTDDVGVTCTDLLVFTVGSPPEVTITAPAETEVAVYGEWVSFAALVQDGEDRPEDLTIRWVSDRDGLLDETPADAAGAVGFSTSSLSAGGHTVSLTVTDTAGLAVVDRVHVAVDTAPGAPVVSLGPVGAGTNDDLIATIDVPSVDADGDPVGYRYDWFQDGVLSSASVSGVLPASATNTGETWRVVVTPNDGVVDGPSGEASLVIRNTPPTVSDATLAPDPAATTGTLTCTPGTLQDADGDSVSVSIGWIINGAAIGETTSTLAAPWFAAGDLVGCTVTPSDGVASGTSVPSNLITVNRPPTIGTVDISPDPATASDLLTCTAGDVADGDGDAVTLDYTWTVNGVDAGTGATLAAPLPGDIVACTVTPSDSLEAGAAQSDALTITNSAPVITLVALSPSSPATNDTLTATATTSDPEGDTVTVSWAWTVNGATIAATTNTLAGATWFQKGDIVVAIATPSDGGNTGAAVSSPSVTVVNTAPGAPSLTISPTSPSPGADDLVCSVTLAATDADADPLSYATTWTRNGVAWTGATLTTTHPGDTIDGAATAAGDLWSCTVTASDGSVSGGAASTSVTVTGTLPTGGSLTTASYILRGQALYDYAGMSTAIVPDLDGDGLDEILVGARCMDRHDGDPYYEGLAYLVLGSTLRATGSMSLSSADYTFVADESDDHLGSSVAGLEDVDGDGVGDFVIGALQGSAGAKGRAYIFSGANLGSRGSYSPSSADWIITGDNTRDYVGSTVASAGDIDGDGLTDIALGAWGYDASGFESAGAVMVFRGQDLGSTSSIAASSARWLIRGIDTYNYLGRVLTAADIDGDGLDDLLLGDDRGKTPHCVHIFTAADLGSTGVFDVTSASFGLSEASDGGSCGTFVDAGDVDGDSVIDVLTGDRDAGTDGVDYVVGGDQLTASLSLDDARYHVSGIPGFYTQNVKAVPDIDGDGGADLLLIDPTWSASSGAQGAVLLMYSSTLSTYGNNMYQADEALYSTAADLLGQASFGLGPAVDVADIDGDGAADYLIGSGYSDDVATDSGRVYVVWGW